MAGVSETSATTEHEPTPATLAAPQQSYAAVTAGGARGLSAKVLKVEGSAE